MFAVAWAVARFAPRIDALEPALLLVPIAFGLVQRRSLEADGIAWKSPRRTLAAVARFGAVLLPLFAAGFLARNRYLLPGVEWTTLRWKFPGADLAIVAFVYELAFHAVPEEVFFRGFVQPRLAARFPAAPRRLLGVPLTPAVVLGAALFAGMHVVFTPRAGRLLTFFPGLIFGALREETGDVVAPSLFHALCNATLYALERGYLQA